MRKESPTKNALKFFQKNAYAVKTPVPNFMPVELAALSNRVPSGKQWLYEDKYDGYRILAVLHKSEVLLKTRNEQNWTHKFLNIAHELQKVDIKSAVFDGEVVVETQDGLKSFSALQKKLSDKEQKGFTYYVFDILYLNGFDLRDAPLIYRKILLKHLFTGHKFHDIKLSPYTTNEGDKNFQDACRKQKEGSVSKNLYRPYRAGRNSEWVKTKCVHRDEFVIAGFTDPQGSRSGFGALLLGYYDKHERLQFAGKVGTGFNGRSLSQIIRKLRNLEIPQNPFGKDIRGAGLRKVHFVKPQLIAQIHYGEWTEDGRLRHPVFLGLREDKRAREVTDPRIRQKTELIKRVS